MDLGGGGGGGVGGSSPLPGSRVGASTVCGHSGNYNCTTLNRALSFWRIFTDDCSPV